VGLRPPEDGAQTPERDKSHNGREAYEKPTRSSLALELGRRLLRRFYECLMTTETINKDLSILLPKRPHIGMMMMV